MTVTTPTPGLPAVSSALAVLAHPDDESFGLGAVLSTLAEAGSRVSVLCFTHGEASTLHGTVGELGTVRADELSAAGGVLGVTRVQLLDYPDGHLAAQPLDELADHVTRLARATDASMLLVFDHGGITGHPDHQQATDAAWRAAPTLGLPVLAFAGRGDDEIDITIAVDRTRQHVAIRCHHSQSADNPVLWRRLDLLGPSEHLRYLS
jgi:N-acetylglucosamine malate deacetylase 2